MKEAGVILPLLLSLNRKNLDHRMSVGLLRPYMIKMILLMPSKVRPKRSQVLILSKFVFLPHGQAHVCRHLVCNFCKLNCLRLRPLPNIGRVAPNIRWININIVLIRGRCKRLLPRATHKRPILTLHNFRRICHLITNSRNICFSESVRFLAKRYIKFAAAIKAYHPIEVRPIQKQKIQRISVFVKSVPHFPIVFLAILLQSLTVVFEKVAHTHARNRPSLYPCIQLNDVLVLIAQKGFFRSHVKGDYARPDKRLYPYTILIPIHLFLYKWNHFCFDPLTFYRRHKNLVFFHACLLRFKGSSMFLAFYLRHILLKRGLKYFKILESSLVPVTGLEPVRCRQRWILSPLRLPIPSHRRVLPVHYTVWRRRLQDKFTGQPPKTETPSWLSAPMMTPASSTPPIHAMTLRLKSMSSRLAASVPVHAPVPGSGMPTKRSSAQ